MRRANAKCSSECKSRPGKGRCDWAAIPAAVEAMKLPDSGRQVAACGRFASAAFVNFFHEFALRFALDGLESVLRKRWPLWKTIMEKFIVDDEDWVVQEPHLHDSKIVGVAIEGGSAQLRLRIMTGKIVSISLNDLRGFSLEAMFEQNVVFEMRITPVAKAPLGDFCRVFHSPADLDVGDSRLSNLKSDDLFFVQIDPTLGADILALCREVTWQFES